MKTPKWIVSLLAVIAFCLLFYDKELGYNVVFFALTNLILFVIFKPSFFKHKLNTFTMSAYVISSLSFSLYNSWFALFVAVSTFMILFAMHSSKPIRNLLLAVPLSLYNYFSAWSGFFNSLFEARHKNKRTRSLWSLLRVIVIPLLIVFVFIWLYSSGSNAFQALITSVSDWFNSVFADFFASINLKLVGVALLGLLFAVIHSLRNTNNMISDLDNNMQDGLERKSKREKSHFKLMDLKFEYRSAVFLFATLNILLTVFLVLEIKNEWFNYSWDGELLKSSVHHGANALLISIVLSIVLIAYFYRRNLNFFPDAKRLKILTYIWIGLNMILVSTVVVRNIHYIEHFALAYKRIGLFVFLLLSLLGLITIYFKLRHKKTNYYLVRYNALFAYIALVGVTLFNWDSIIAKYNLSHADSAFIHASYVKRLSDKALPYLQLSQTELDSIQKLQTNYYKG